MAGPGSVPLANVTAAKMQSPSPGGGLSLLTMRQAGRSYVLPIDAQASEAPEKQVSLAEMTI